jgi:hypothetical protein
MIEAICAASAVADVAHIVAPSASRARCWIVDAGRGMERNERLALPPPRD